MRTISTICLVAGLLLVAIVAGILADSARFEFKAAHSMRRVSERMPAHERNALSAPGPGELIGWLQVPRLGVSAAISQGTSTRTLLRSVGHVEGTALPGDATGNVGLAGHRDIHFRKLQEIEPGDTVLVQTSAGRFEYMVDSTQIVKPDRTEVLDPTASPTLTLLTCYPFRYVGHAPKRFVVHATLREKGAITPRVGSGSRFSLPKNRRTRLGA